MCSHCQTLSRSSSYRNLQTPRASSHDIWGTLRPLKYQTHDTIRTIHLTIMRIVVKSSSQLMLKFLFFSFLCSQSTGCCSSSVILPALQSYCQLFASAVTLFSFRLSTCLCLNLLLSLSPLTVYIMSNHTIPSKRRFERAPWQILTYKVSFLVTAVDITEILHGLGTNSRLSGSYCLHHGLLSRVKFE